MAKPDQRHLVDRGVGDSRVASGTNSHRNRPDKGSERTDCSLEFERFGMIRVENPEEPVSRIDPCWIVAAVMFLAVGALAAWILSDHSHSARRGPAAESGATARSGP